MKALEKLNHEMDGVAFPGNYILFERTKVYIGQAGNVYDRLKTHIKNPEDKIKNWDNALVLNDGRPATQSDFNDTVVRLALEAHLIRLFKANKYRVVCQGERPTLNSIQKQIVGSLIREVNYFLLKKNVITKVLEDEGLVEIFQDELNKLGTSGKWIGEIGISYDREKSFGAPEVKITPLVALIWPSAQTIFLSRQLQGPDLQRPPTH